MHDINALLSIMARLRDPEKGCPWDIEQDFASIAPCTLEEAYEVAEAIAQGDMAALKEELGDLLLQVVFHSQMAKEAGHFTFEEVASAITEKLIRRHPHVFGDAVVESAEAQTAAWEAIKAEEKKSAQKTVSALDDVPLALPSLARAQKLQKRAARTGFDWPDIAPVWDKLHEEIQELQEAAAGSNQGAMAEELGDMLFACVNLARHLKLDAEEALRAANRKFERRFRYVERKMDGKPHPLAQLDTWWEEAKHQEKKSDAA